MACIKRTIVIAATLIVGLSTSCSREPQFPETPLKIATKDGEPKGKIPDDLVALLRNADRFVLYSLSPVEKPSEPNGFHKFPVIGQVVIENQQARTELVEELIRVNSHWVDNNGAWADCFEPRHGIRVQRGGETVDFVICFMCIRARYYTSKGRSGFGVSHFPEKFNDTLSKAGIRVAPE